MKAFLITGLLVLAVAITAIAQAPQPPADPPKFTAEEAELLALGKPVKKAETLTMADGSSGGTGVAYIKIKATPEQIFKTILDYNTYKEFYPHVKSSELYKQDGNLYFAKFKLSLAGVLKVTYHCRHVYNPKARTLTWTLDKEKKNDLNQTAGFWKMWPSDDGQTLLGYSIFIDSGMSVPKFVEEMATGYGLKKVATCMKQRVETGKCKR